MAVKQGQNINEFEEDLSAMSVEEWKSVENSMALLLDVQKNLMILILKWIYNSFLWWLRKSTYLRSIHQHH